MMVVVVMVVMVVMVCGAHHLRRFSWSAPTLPEKANWDAVSLAGDLDADKDEATRMGMLSGQSRVP